jgi:hypothetical protein
MPENARQSMGFWALFICRAVFCDYRSPIAALLYWRARRRYPYDDRPLLERYREQQAEKPDLQLRLANRASAVNFVFRRNLRPAPWWWGYLPRRVATYIGWATGVVFRHQLQDACIRRG